jgi:hypothetical protein
MSFRIIITTIIVFIAVDAHAQILPPPIGPPPNNTPIDGGLSLVMAACACYGAKKLKRNKGWNKK